MPKKSGSVPRPKPRKASCRNKPSKTLAKPETRRDQLLGVLSRVLSNMHSRRNLLARIPRRGFTRNVPKVGLEYRIASNGQKDLLTGITEGRLDVVTVTLIEELIAELSQQDETDA